MMIASTTATAPVIGLGAIAAIARHFGPDIGHAISQVMEADLAVGPQILRLLAGALGIIIADHALIIGAAILHHAIIGPIQLRLELGDQIDDRMNIARRCIVELG